MKLIIANGSWHNICNPSRIWYLYIGKIWEKHYHIYSNRYNKLTWMNLIKKYMKEDLIEYYPNDRKNIKMSFYPNGNKWHEQPL